MTLFSDKLLAGQIFDNRYTFKNSATPIKPQNMTCIKRRVNRRFLLLPELGLKQNTLIIYSYGQTQNLFYKFCERVTFYAGNSLPKQTS